MAPNEASQLIQRFWPRVKIVKGGSGAESDVLEMCFDAIRFSDSVGCGASSPLPCGGGGLNMVRVPKFLRYVSKQGRVRDSLRKKSSWKDCEWQKCILNQAVTLATGWRRVRRGECWFPCCSGLHATNRPCSLSAAQVCVDLHRALFERFFHSKISTQMFKRLILFLSELYRL